MNLHSFKAIKLCLAIVLIVFLIILLSFIPYDIFNLHYLQAHFSDLKSCVETNHFKAVMIFVTSYLIVAGFSLPFATILTLLSGALFGLWEGLILSLASSTVGATIAFLLSRYFLGDLFNNFFRSKSEIIKKEFDEKGTLYLLTLRIAPIFPFFLVNLAMGLTSISVRQYFICTALGMIPGLVVYTFAGLTFLELTSIQSILNFKTAAALLLLALLPAIGKWISWHLTKYRTYKPFNKPRVFEYNVIVIGGGSAGLVTANITTSLGAKVALIEKNRMGGDCLNSGCVPSKSLIHLSKQKIDFSKVMSDVHTTIAKIAPHDSRERYESIGVKCFSGEAKVLSPYEVQINEQVLTTKNIVLATGAEPFIPPIPGLASIDYLTSNTLWNLEELPSHFLVCGGGAIGVELAQAFARLGSNVTLVEKQERLLSREDREASRMIEEQLSRDGIKLYLNSEILSFNQNIVHIKNSSGELTLNFDKVLIALGRKPSHASLLPGLKLNPDNTIWTNSFLQTSIPNIYACGDAAGPFQFTHFASHQAKVVALNILFGFIKKFWVDHKIVPRCTYCDPEISAVGLNAEELINKQIAFEETIFSYENLDRAIIEEVENGFVKVWTEAQSDKILGVTIVGKNSSLQLQEFILAMENNLGLNTILDSIHPYPGFSDANKQVASYWKKKRLSENLKEILIKLQKFRRK